MSMSDIEDRKNIEDRKRRMIEGGLATVALTKYLLDLDIFAKYLPNITFHNMREGADVYVIIGDSVKADVIKRLDERIVDGYRITPTLVKPSCINEHEGDVAVEFVIKKVQEVSKE